MAYYNRTLLFFVDWIIACASLVIIALLVDLVATVLTGVGLNTQHPERKFIFYRAAMYLMFFAGNHNIGGFPIRLLGY